MTKRIRIKKKCSISTTLPEETVSTEEAWVLDDGTSISTGDVLLVRHLSFSDKWIELPLKKITQYKGVPAFHFYFSPPGAITVAQERVKPLPVKTTRKKKDS